MLYKRNSFQIWVRILSGSTIILVSALMLMLYLEYSLLEEKIAYPIEPIVAPANQKLPSEEIREKKLNSLPVSMNSLQSFLKVYQIPARPTSSDNGSRLFFDIEGSLYPVASQKAYLEVQGEKLVLTDKKTNSYLEIKANYGGFLEIEQSCELDDPFSKQLQEKCSLPIKLLKANEIFSNPVFLDVQKWEFLGLNELEALKGHHVYLMKIGNQLYDIKAGSSLFFDKSWEVGASLNSPYIYIKEISSEKIDLELWSKGDDLYNKLEIKKKYSPKKSLRISDVISDIHMRNKDQISLIAGKHKIFLKEGEIAVKRNGKWTFFSDSVDDFQNEMYIHLEKIKKNRDLVINVLEKNRVVVHNFIVPVSRGSFAKKTHP